jgi:hypothetical protein
MKHLISFLFSTLLCVSGHPQINLIVNPGFEGGTHEPVFRCYSEGFGEEYVNNWTSEFYCKKKCEAEQSNCKCCLHAHSPDWYCHGILVHYNVPYGHDGSLHYVGLGNYELIQQELNTNHKFEKGKRYTMTFYTYLSGLDCYNIANCDFTKSTLKVWFGKKRIKYKSNERHTVNYTKHKNPVGQDIKEMYYQGLSAFNLYSWNKVSFSFNAPSSNYNWIAIEVVLNNVTGANDLYSEYILIDDVQIIKTSDCDYGCTSLDGPKEPWCNHLITEQQPLMIWGLKNNSYAKIEILTIYPQSTIWAQEFFYPSDRLIWEGKDFNNTNVANGQYVLKLTLTNECGTDVFTQNIMKINSYIPSNPPLYSNYSNVTKPPDFCCMPIIYIQDQVLVQDKTLDGPLMYKAINAISAGPNVIVPPGNEVVFEAGTEIILLPGFSAEHGAEFVARIVPCISGKSFEVITNDNGPDLSALILEDAQRNTTEEHENNMVRISPNPSPGYFVFHDPQKEFENAVLQVFGVAGALIHSQALQNLATQQIDLSHLADGMYYVRVFNRERSWVEKVVIQR